MQQRRHFLKELGLAAAGVVVGSRAFSIPRSQAEGSLSFGVISDLHHLQFGQCEEVRVVARFPTKISDHVLRL